MSTLTEIEAAVEALPAPQQEELLRHLAERLGKRQKPERSLPLVPPTGHPITQEEIDDAVNADCGKLQSGQNPSTGQNHSRRPMT